MGIEHELPTPDLDTEVNKYNNLFNEKYGFNLRRAITDDRERIREWHIGNHMEECTKYPGEKERKESKLTMIFPHLYDDNKFKSSNCFLVVDNTD